MSAGNSPRSACVHNGLNRPIEYCCHGLGSGVYLTASWSGTCIVPLNRCVVGQEGIGWVSCDELYGSYASYVASCLVCLSWSLTLLTQKCVCCFQTIITISHSRAITKHYTVLCTELFMVEYFATSLLQPSCGAAHALHPSHFSPSHITPYTSHPHALQGIHTGWQCTNLTNTVFVTTSWELSTIFVW